MSEKVFLKDIAGYEDEKKEAGNIIDILVHFEEYSKYGAYVPKGLILSGAPGVGKTMLAKAIATEANVPFYSLDVADNEEKDILSNIKMLFEKAKQSKPSIIFIDELDEIVTGSFEDDASRKALKVLLTELDGTASSDGVLVIATTNSYRHLPQSLLRSGRMDKTIEFAIPDQKNREAIFNLYLSKNPFLKDVDGVLLSKKTVGFSCADIRNLINSTIIKCIKAKDAITTKAMEDMIPSIMFKDIKRENEEKANPSVLYHEIGHFLVGYELTHSYGDIVCEKYKSANGFVRFAEEDDDVPFFGRKRRLSSTKLSNNVNNKDIINQLAIFLGGRAAEEMLAKKITCGAGGDVEHAKNVIANMLFSGCFGFDYPSSYDMHSGIVSQRKLNKFEKKSNSMLNKAYKIARRSIKKNMKYVNPIYKELENKRKLTGDELKVIMAV